MKKAIVIIQIVLIILMMGLIGKGKQEMKMRNTNYTDVYNISNIRCLLFTNGGVMCNNTDITNFIGTVLWVQSPEITSNRSIVSGNVNVSGNITANTGAIELVGTEGYVVVSDELWVKTNLHGGYYRMGVFRDFEQQKIVADSGDRLFITQTNDSYTFYGAGNAVIIADNDLVLRLLDGNTFRPHDNKAENLGAADKSWDNCYCDDHVNTPRQLISLEKFNNADYEIITKGNNGELIYSTLENEDYWDNLASSTFQNMELKVYNNHIELLEDIPYNYTTGEIDFMNIPIPLRDKNLNEDTLSGYALQMTNRNAILELKQQIVELELQCGLIAS